jgi:hypothetical protein
MDKQWEDMTQDEKLDWLRQNIENLRGQLRLFAIELEIGQRVLNDRIVKLEQTFDRG